VEKRLILFLGGSLRMIIRFGKPENFEVLDCAEKVFHCEAHYYVSCADACEHLSSKPWYRSPEPKGPTEKNWKARAALLDVLVYREKTAENDDPQSNWGPNDPIAFFALLRHCVDSRKLPDVCPVPPDNDRVECYCGGYFVAITLKGNIPMAKSQRRNDHQHIELFNEPPTAPPNMMSHLCFTVDHIEAMRTYLRAKGFRVKPGDGGKTRTGDYAFEIKDPDGMLVEFVQGLPTGMEAQAAGKFQPSTRISTKIYHLGFLVGNSEKSMDFYGNILGFQETWRGGANPKQLSWINMRVPDGNDYVEFMLYAKAPDKFGTKNHIALSVPDISKSLAILQARPAAKEYGKEMTIATGVNQKRQMNLYDPDGTRVELMEENTVTGKPTPPSTAPPPPPAHD
jgi:catechol 2,3-dioxygenase-like lactoylglutathione lyase family enzyme